MIKIFSLLVFNKVSKWRGAFKISLYEPRFFKLRMALKCIYLPSKIWISILGQNKDIEMKGQFCFEKHLKCLETQEHCSNTQNKTIKTENSQVRRICIPIRNARTKIANDCSYLWFQIIRYFFATNTFSEKRLYSIIFESQKQKQ